MKKRFSGCRAILFFIPPKSFSYVSFCAMLCVVEAGDIFLLCKFAFRLSVSTKEKYTHLCSICYGMHTLIPGPDGKVLFALLSRLSAKRSEKQHFNGTKHNMNLRGARRNVDMGMPILNCAFV